MYSTYVYFMMRENPDESDGVGGALPGGAANSKEGIEGGGERRRRAAGRALARDASGLSSAEARESAEVMSAGGEESWRRPARLIRLPCR